MKTTENTNPNLSNKTLKKHHWAKRLWHWSNAFLFFCTLSIVLINFTILNPKNHWTYVQEAFSAKGVNISEAEALTFAQYFSDRLWICHAYIGYGIASLFAFRIILEAILPNDESLFSRIKNFLKLNNDAARKSRFGILFLCTFYFLIFLIVVTGLSITQQNNIPFLKGSTEAVAVVLKIHKFTMYGLVICILFHIFTVVKLDRKVAPGTISEMINGGKKKF